MLAKSPGLSLRALAEKVDETPSTLVHYFKLLKLVPGIQSFLAGLHDPKAIHFYSLRRLMPLAGMEESDQRRMFAQMKDEFGASSVVLGEGCSVAVRSQQATGNRIRLF